MIMAKNLEHMQFIYTVEIQNKYIFPLNAPFKWLKESDNEDLITAEKQLKIS